MYNLSPRILRVFVCFLFILFLAALSLRCCARAFSSCGERGLLFVAVCSFSLRWLVAEHRLQACRFQQSWCAGSVVVARGFQSAGSVAVAHGLSCSATCGIFPDQGSNPCPLHQRWILNHCATRKSLLCVFLRNFVNEKFC